MEYNKCKLNFIDNPGYFDFAGQIAQSLRVADAGDVYKRQVQPSLSAEKIVYFRRND